MDYSISDIRKMIANYQLRLQSNYHCTSNACREQYSKLVSMLEDLLTYKQAEERWDNVIDSNFR